MSIPDGSDPYFSRRKMEEAQPVKEEKDERVFIFPPESASFPMINNMLKVLFPIFTLIWRVNDYVSRQGKV